jgi:hypothetical protein
MVARSFRRREGRQGRNSARRFGHERHAAHRRAAHARHLHGGPVDPARPRHQPPAESKKTTDVTPDISQIVLQFDADKRISVNKQDVTMQELETRLRNIYDQRKDKTMFLIAAGTIRYKDIVDVIDAAKGAGVEKVGIVTEGMRKAGGRRVPTVRSQSVTKLGPLLQREAALFFCDSRLQTSKCSTKARASTASGSSLKACEEPRHPHRLLNRRPGD